jgi:hypothetical protein
MSVVQKPTVTFTPDELEYLLSLVVDELRITLEDGVGKSDPCVQLLTSLQDKLDVLTGHVTPTNHIWHLLDELAQ